MINKILREKNILFGLFGLIAMALYEHAIMQLSMGYLVVLSAMFILIVLLASSVAHHAEVLAHRLGEPYGTLILTISAVVVEIVIIMAMLTHSHNPHLARDTIYSAVMLDINGLLGFAAIVGGLKYGEQPYNVDSSNSYLSMLIVSIGIAMVFPHFVSANSIYNYHWFVVVVFIILYGIFTRVQLKSHKYFFEYRQPLVASAAKEHEDSKPTGSILVSTILLVTSIVIIGVLSEFLSVAMTHTLEHFELPLALGAVVVALVSAAPELITAIKAATENRMQTVINIALGASLATVLLTIPSVILLSMFLDKGIDLALTPIQGALFGLTLLVSMINFGDGETNALEGFLHMALFATFVAFVFLG